MIRLAFLARLQPLQIPFDGVIPLFELPVLPLTVPPEDFGAPEDFRGLTTCGEFLAEAEVFEPLQNEEESGSFPVGESAERGEIFSPTPPGLFISCFGYHAFKKTAS